MEDLTTLRNFVIHMEFGHLLFQIDAMFAAPLQLSVQDFSLLDTDLGRTTSISFRTLPERDTLVKNALQAEVRLRARSETPPPTRTTIMLEAVNYFFSAVLVGLLKAVKGSADCFSDAVSCFFP
uniref:Uncharacterized protein n=1 Tax=Chromera velia CCMP2878 TaxID=1169474 RepID=A0A0G4GRT9_9ALVE|eukprot:Cvel_23032.t1-p1 / transcript=Cvel_23032.t1 / gene=Cvel_23032 / organism=Chromera_velia_CCMP2878 / gene_product=hypothetical protein / transcript_product=hypothetical protein / location=Cvel_scaffold2328:678-2973(-) / protein_length=123 / sequence_SO=supercontig / SO=protein_coding / is_pseudo=false